MGFAFNGNAEHDAEVVTIVRMAMITKEFTPEGAQKIATALEALLPC